VPESFLILHGLGNHRPPQHWEFLLAAHLVEAGHDVRYPDLPDSDLPNLDAWLRVLEDELASLTEPTVTVVCHSLSCLLWFHAAARHLTANVDRVILVAPPASEQIPEDVSTFWVPDFDAAAVNASAREVTIVCSDNDPFSPRGPSLYSKELGIMPIVIPGAGHITHHVGYGYWPFIIDWCLRRV
jgi:predicted alpha/beta hydrolase family esterase